MERIHRIIAAAPTAKPNGSAKHLKPMKRGKAPKPARGPARNQNFLRGLITRKV